MPRQKLNKDYEDTIVNEEKNIEESIQDGILPSGFTAREEQEIIAQIQEEFNLCYNAYESKLEVWRKRLKLYNNQKKKEESVGEPLLFTVFNTVFSSLYVDRFNVSFSGRIEGKDSKAENLTNTASYDYEKMELDEQDYDWDWDACFFGKGYQIMYEFDRKSLTPIVETIDPLCFLKDENCKSISGDQRNRGQARFFGRIIAMTKYDIVDAGSYFNIDSIQKGSVDYKSLYKDNKEARAEAQGRDHNRYDEESLTNNCENVMLEWWTHWKGVKYIFTLANGNTLLVKAHKLASNKWPIYERSIFPIGHDADGVSIPDLIEDKQRAKAILLNTVLKSAKSSLNNTYIYNKDKISNKKYLEEAFNRHIPVKGDPNNAISLAPKAGIQQQVDYILNLLDISAQKATASPEISQGVQPSEQRTLGENQLVSRNSSIRQNLITKIFGWSERRRWRQWYWCYKHYLASEDIKLVRINGAISDTWTELKKDKMIFDDGIDPDVTVESAYFSQLQKRQKYAETSNFAQVVLQDPSVSETSKRHIERRLAKLSGMPNDDIYMIFPETYDELDAKEENSQIMLGELPKVEDTDDDLVHIYIHNKVQVSEDKQVKAQIAHINAHKKMMKVKKQEAMKQEAMNNTAPQGMDMSPISLPSMNNQPITNNQNAGIGEY